MRRINLFTIPAGAAFADALARGVVARYATAGDPFALSRVLILLPTRRAIRTLGDAFVRVSPQSTAVLPRMRALGDFDDDPTLFEVTGEDVVFDGVPMPPPPMAPLKRELLLTRLILFWSQREERQAAGVTSPALALKLARDLIALLDQATAEGLAWERLETLVPDDLSKHWAQTLEFLTILTREWPKILAEHRASDPTVHRDAALRRAAAQWRETPPDYPVVAAGSTGSVPATAELLKTIAYMPNGAVVLPAIDLSLDRETWEATEPGHPQHGMRQLLAKFDATRRDVESWTADDGTQSAVRVRLIAEALRPAETTPAWRDLVQERRGVIEGGLRGLTMLVARTPSEEALAIALALREAVETPGKTAALVTPDRTLARRVASELKRWGIAIDDSGGTPLSQTIPGRFLSLIADAAADRFAPVPLLSLLKHPLTAAGYRDQREARHLAGILEERALRGPRPAPGFEGLRQVVERAELKQFVAQLELACGAFAAMAEGEHDLCALIRLHRHAAELLSSFSIATEQPLWSHAAGEAAATLFAALDEAASGIDLTMTGGDYAAFIREAMDAVQVRPKVGQHERLSILGPLEVRLQRADLMILGGLNEGVWPPATDPGPWLNRPMRRELDLSQPERRVGLSAHDFAQAAACPEVLLTRAEKDGGAPTTPSRWLTRLTMLVDGAGLGERLHGGRLLALARALDRPVGPPKPIEAPAPRPPLAARPRELAVTDVEKWVRDPYAIYAKRILKLRELDPIDQLPDAPQRGQRIHKALESFVKLYPSELPDDEEAREVLLRCGREAFGELLEQPSVRGFWWPRFERITSWFIEFERQRRASALKIVAEQKGTMEIDAPGGKFLLKATADRIELLPGDAVVIADYKTGTAPTTKQVLSGLSPQLTLEAAIALHGGFPGIAALSVAELLYVSLKGATIAGREAAIELKNTTADAEAGRARQGLARFVAEFDADDMPYLSRPRVLLERFPGDYDHLARVKEWSAGMVDDEW